jgi:hypothetical protein
LFAPFGKAKLVGCKKFDLHESILCALSINSAVCSDIFNRIKWKPWWCKFMFIIISVDSNGSYNAVPETVMIYYHKSKEDCIKDKEAVLVQYHQNHFQGMKLNDKSMTFDKIIAFV